MDSPKLTMERRDFWKLGPVWVWKWGFLGAVLAGSLAVIGIFGLPGGLVALPGGEPPAYQYDDPALATRSGVAQVLDENGVVRYRGEVDSGSFTGIGQVFDWAGRLVYDGPLTDGVREGPGAKVYENGTLIYEGEMVQDAYEGEGRRVNEADGTVSLGQFVGGELEGRGEERAASGVLIREGSFSGDVLSGPGREYSAQGALLREGTFEQGLLQGEGAEYGEEGGLLYEGEFRRGVYHGQGTLYDSSGGAAVYEGEFVDGSASGTGRLYHPSGQLLYEGEVKDGRPRADAFLGLSLAEVEAAFGQHWQLYYAQDGSGAFVYPAFQLMFWTDGPVELASPTRKEAQARRERRELLAALSAANREQEETGETKGTPPVVQGALEEPLLEAEPALDMALEPDTDKSGLIIREVLSYGQSLPGVAQPEADAPGERAKISWRERFSDFAAGRDGSSSSAIKTGPFVYEFPTWTDTAPVERASAAGDGVETVTAYRQDKEGALWYQSARQEETP